MQTEMKEAAQAVMREKTPKGSTLKKAAEDAYEKLGMYAGDDANFPNYAKATKDVQAPFVRALLELSTKNKSFLQCVSVVQKIIACGSVHPDSVEGIIKGLDKIVESYPEVRIKALQMLLPFVQEPTLVRGGDVLHLFRIGAKLAEKSRNQSVNTSVVIMCQVAAAVFERPLLLKGEEKAQAVEDCKGILTAATEKPQKGNTFGLDVLLVCVCEGKAAFQNTELEDHLEHTLVTLLQNLEEKTHPEATRTLQILREAVSSIFQSTEKITNILRTVMEKREKLQLQTVKEELAYQLPYKIVKQLCKSSPELCDLIFSIEESVPAEKLVQPHILYIEQINRTEIPTDASYLSSLKFFKIVKTIEEIRQELSERSENESNEDLYEMVRTFIPYYQTALERISNLETIRNGLNIAKNIRQTANSLLEMSALPEGDRLGFFMFHAAEKNPKVFYSIARDVMMKYRGGLTIWPQFFNLTFKIQDATPEDPVWTELTAELEKYTTEDLKIAIQGASKAKNMSCKRSSELFLALVFRIDDGLENEFSTLISKVFNEKEMAKDVQGSCDLTTSFLGTYFISQMSETAHKIVLKQLQSVFSFFYAREEGQAILKEILMALSLGVRVSGENFHGSWAIVFEIMSLAIESPNLYRTVFDIAQVVTDRLLPVLPSECLIGTARLLCVFCVTIREDNISFQSLKCIRELTEHIFTSEVPEEVKRSVWHISLCVLCAMAYDTRNDMRDSAISQIIESICYCREKGQLDWRPLVQVFMKRLLGAAVYAKYREIYSGEYDEEYSDEKEEIRGGESCPCRNMGACIVQVCSSPVEETGRRSEESAKGILFAVSSMVFENFDQIKKTVGFKGLWRLFCKILIRFSQDPGMEDAFVSTLRAGLPRITGRDYWKSYFGMVSEACQYSRGKKVPPETILQILKFSYGKSEPEPSGDEPVAFFRSISALLRCSDRHDEPKTSFLEFEAVCALEEEGSATSPSIRIKTLIEWIKLSRESLEALSIEFVIYCMRSLVGELKAVECSEEIHRKVVEVLVSFHSSKKMYPHHWAAALSTLKNIFRLETRREIPSQIVWASKEILGLVNGTRLASPTAAPSDVRKPSGQKNRNILRAISENANYVEAMKEEERSMSEYLRFLERLVRGVKIETLRSIYEVILEIWGTSLENSLHALYLESSKILCDIVSRREEMQPEAVEWSLYLLKRYNTGIRMERMSYSHFEREAVSYVLEQILEKKIQNVLNKQFLKEIASCVFSEDNLISQQAAKILQNTFGNGGS